MTKVRLADLLSKYTVVYHAEHSRWNGLVILSPNGQFRQCKGEHMESAVEVGCWKLETQFHFN